MVALVLLTLSSRLQPGERLRLYSHGGTRVRSVTHIQDGFCFVAGESVDWMYKHLAFPSFRDRRDIGFRRGCPAWLMK